MTAPSLPPIGPDWKVWAQQLTRTLLRGLVTLNFKSAGDIPSENGIILWDEANGYPVVSKNDEFRQIVLADGFASLSIASDVTAAIADTAYPLTYTIDSGDGVTLGTPASRIVFDEGGEYLVSFTAQIESSTVSTVTFYFWPRVNGVDATGSTIRATLHDNGATKVVSRTARFVVSAGDYLEAMWAVSNTNGQLTAFTATAFAPAAPASTLAITRVRA